jgi:asparagine synthase (glutamine-hydrolysing)
VAAFERLRGMYACALWDGHRRQGVLARDGCGIKPLFYRHSAEHLYFASEAKAILAATGDCALDEGQLHLLLNFRYLPGEGSLFRGISQVAPGEVITWIPDGRLHQAPHFLRPEPPEEGLIPTLRDAVAAHLTADVEVGAYLSGGMDSAAIAALAHESSPGLRTFTLAMGDDACEAAHAAETARLLGVGNLQAAPDVDAAALLPRLVWHLETPKINALQIALVSRLAARSVKVVLSGLGGDELFYGYRAHGYMDWAARLAGHLPRPLTTAAGGLAAFALSQAGPPWGEPERAARMLSALGDWPRVYGLLRNVWDAPGLRRRIYGPRMLDAPLPDAFATLAALWPRGPDPVIAMARFEWRQKMVNDLLWQEDRASMAYGLEVRVPFLDPHLAAWAAARPRATLMPGGQLKGLFRRELSTLLPAPILRRPKSGFQVDAPTFFHQHLRPLAAVYLTEEAIRAHGLFNPDFVTETLRRPPAKSLRWHYFILYFMLLTHLWLAAFPPQAARKSTG